MGDVPARPVPPGGVALAPGRPGAASADADAAAGAFPAPRELGRLATLALYHELALAPKPGLVSFADTGSHADMDASTFMRSLFALRSYFPAIAQAGAHGASMDALQALGLQAEARMMTATGGTNTHRGAIFTLGLLCAAAGRAGARQAPRTPQAVQDALLEGWGEALALRARRAAALPPVSKGQRVAQALGLRSAGEEAALGFPVLFGSTLPALREARRALGSGEAALVHALMATIAVLDDTNLAHRGGAAGLAFAQDEARAFMTAGGALQAGWRARAWALHHRFVARRLSPGGAADLLGCAWWLDRVCAP
ncbi:triphosphoribosyl-dephospho-CoA synthase MdcB [Ramlibacter aquaticus]|uniref:Probable 2-(5''-triphosphoribosyl)-3'-dephosphocoenzyme-A synthase n=2 Tax=Comamonadaceae TaxID=80864 RepID=A0ABR9SIB4_9BURK|nr:triphosphoribosyl-dephospho-CoA synthase MdcB [Ramlibacter aquaticus]